LANATATNVNRNDSKIQVKEIEARGLNTACGLRLQMSVSFSEVLKLPASIGFKQ